MAEQGGLDDALRADGDRDRLVRAPPPLARSDALCEKLDHSRFRLSAGIAQAAAPCDAHHLFTRADEALHAARAAGRDTVRNDLPRSTGS